MTAAVSVRVPFADPRIDPGTVDSHPAASPELDRSAGTVSAPGRTEVEVRHAWYPTSPCGSHCLDDAGPRVGRIVVALRIARLVTTAVMIGLVGLMATVAPRLVRRAYLRWAARELLRAIGIRVIIDDRRPFPSRARGLIVANHISYLDILAIAVVQPAHFVAKSDVAAMPGISTLARRLGVICIDRGSLRTLPTVISEAVAGLERDSSVAVFPEGTTWCGRAQGGFRPAFFQSALDAGVPILPIGIAFSADGIPTAETGFIGDDGPADTLARVLRMRAVAVHVSLHEPQLPSGDRRTMAARCEQLIRSAPRGDRASIRHRESNNIYDVRTPVRGVTPLFPGPEGAAACPTHSHPRRS
ncbi:lysophospholipid acyltransferase family protein [Gordonia sp. i37]|uniref:lysophospholipid acyltransferase family protein n=1 Tax=Gordonia sp. i37 TaxID=1961707 RepID=UPI0009AC0511|nr:lysophospholipid acyltransferase family protein [Gordonia sp. i37]OPX14509.1 1-acyl-sn-glycerol-3-phosphate acyltransferase [Gordonia sp. i37]